MVPAVACCMLIRALLRTGHLCPVQVLSDELDEEYFHQRHLRLRQQLQYLATQAALSSVVHPKDQKQQQSDLWEDCCTIPLQQQKLQGMLQGWAAERANVLQLQQGWPLQAQQLQELAATWEVDIRQHSGSGKLCTGATNCACHMLHFFWEKASFRNLQQQRLQAGLESVLLAYAYCHPCVCPLIELMQGG
jgi:hypothetical protein